MGKVVNRKLTIMTLGKPRFRQRQNPTCPESGRFGVWGHGVWAANALALQEGAALKGRLRRVRLNEEPTTGRGENVGYGANWFKSRPSAHDPVAVISAFSQNEIMDEAEILEKLHRLEVTDSHLERNSLALELSDTKDPRLFRPLVELIQRPQLVNNRGTLVYCLENYDCSSIVDLLVELTESGNFEVSAGAETILNEQRLG